MLIFKKISPENTAVALKIAFDKAKELSTDLVLSTTTGASALIAMKFAADTDFKGRIIVVTHV